MASKPTPLILVATRKGAWLYHGSPHAHGDNTRRAGGDESEHYLRNPRGRHHQDRGGRSPRLLTGFFLCAYS
jgi:hypothetical protein